MNILLNEMQPIILHTVNEMQMMCHKTQLQYQVLQWLHLIVHITVEPQFNDLRYNNIPGITINNLLPTQQKLL